MRKKAYKTIVFLFILTLAGMVFLNSGFFAVKRVVTDAPGWLKSRVVALAGVSSGVNIWRIDPVAVAAKVGQDPWVSGVTVSRSLPDTITIKVTPARVVGLVFSHRSFFQVDEKGRILGRERDPLPEGVPFLTWDGSPNAGLKVGKVETLKPLVGLLAAVGALAKTKIKVDEVNGSKGEITAYSGAGAVIFLGAIGPEAVLASRLGPLPMVLANLAKRGEKAVRLDVSRPGNILVLPVKG